MTARTTWITIMLLVGMLFSLSGCQKALFAAYHSTSTASADNISSSAEVMDLEDMGVSVIQKGDNVYFNVPTDTFFKYGTAEFNPDYRWVIDEIVLIIKDYDMVPIRITGYTDNVGAEQFKKQLSLNRAQRFETYLWSKGVDFRLIKSKGKGSRHRIATNRSVKGSGLNRRVMIHLRLNAHDTMV